MPVSEALNLARAAGLDLVEVSPTETPPVCRIMNYGRIQYEKKKRLKQGAGSHVIVLKEVRFRPKTDENDRLIKMNRARRFLGEGHKVQFTMLFRGRERMHRDRAREMFEALLAEFGEAVKVERRPIMDGRRMTMVVSPTKMGIKEMREATEKLAAAKDPGETATKTPAETPTAVSGPVASQAPVATGDPASSAQVPVKEPVATTGEGSAPESAASRTEPAPTGGS
ncbi:MAG: translation initiation factor IF-3 [Planctomycetes bacterium]|nr:translation initiation factor IF-3 [Planctomycetota bacterium]